ncbi:hypothetical protein TH15_04150 [Thalassospira profundimaris]|uniref:Uncharacterized protein n=1 Tax=Thalassospira indica TaxID=1891279 RepID=A0ABN5ND85_9PROT|nr:hypothetical protein DY252_01930 [Thalassospira indica]OAZ14990.1 hypothetical protein TH15_04150 [Thalassospira profundimaris]
MRFSVQALQLFRARSFNLSLTSPKKLQKMFFQVLIGEIRSGSGSNLRGTTAKIDFECALPRTARLKAPEINSSGFV